MTQIQTSAATARERFHLIDALRGLMLVLLTLNHIKGNPARWLTFEPFGFFGAAEGFVFLSGLLAGYIYLKASLTAETLRPVIVRRVWLIGLALLSLLVLQPILTQFFDEDAHTTLSLASFQLPNPLRGSEILGLYLGLFSLSYIVLRLLHAERLKTLLTISLCLYALSFAPEAYRRISTIHFEAGDQIARVLLFLNGSVPTPRGELLDGFRRGGFSLLSWQFLFVVAAAIGFYKRKGETFSWLKQSWLVPTVAIACAILFLTRHFLDVRTSAALSLLTAKDVLAPLRLASFSLFALLCFALHARTHRKLRAPVLELLGQHSLAVYVYQTLMVFGLLNTYLPDISSPLVRILLIALFCLTLPAVAKTAEFLSASPAKRSPRQHRFLRSLSYHLGVSGFQQWKQQVLLFFVSLYASIHLYHLIQIREDYPFTSASMFGRYIGKDTKLFAVQLYSTDQGQLELLDFDRYKINRRILLYAVYCGDEDDSPYYSPTCADADYPERMQRWFDHLCDQYEGVHGRLPATFTLQLEPRNGYDQTITLGSYNCYNRTFEPGGPAISAALDRKL